MGESKAISIRIPDELLDKVNKLAEEKYKSIAGKPNKSQVIQNALIAYFKTLSDSVSDEEKVAEYDTVSLVDFKELQAFVATLSEEVERLKKEKVTASCVVTKFDSIEIEDELSNESLPELVEKVELKITNKLVDQQKLSISVPEAISGMSGTKLSERLNYDNGELGKRSKKSKEEFADWSKGKDPEGIAWERRDKKYYPLPASLSEGEAEAQTNHP
jgi:metal-responsive CopG/Arc/MetJ family transcriptional regulator